MFLLAFLNNFREPDFGFQKSFDPNHVSSANYGYSVIWICTTFAIVSRLTSPAALKVKLILYDVINLRWFIRNCSYCPPCRIGDCA